MSLLHTYEDFSAYVLLCVLLNVSEPRARTCDAAHLSKGRRRLPAAAAAPLRIDHPKQWCEILVVRCWCAVQVSFLGETKSERGRERRGGRRKQREEKRRWGGGVEGERKGGPAILMIDLMITSSRKL